MKYISTRNKEMAYSLSQAIQLGLAPDGGLFVPQYLPQINLEKYLDVTSEKFGSQNLETFPKFSHKLLEEFFSDDDLSEKLSFICNNAFSFPLPICKVNENTFMLELFHGPTSSFKDFGARFLAECVNRLTENKKVTILVATSGDTGSAVANAFYEKENVNVVILYPKGRISELQEKQIASFGKNILALAVNGSFDDCQNLVKAAFANPWWQNHAHVSSANSINIGRLLPQITYYAYSSLNFYKQYQQMPGYIVPTGNLGNATAAYYAKAMGFPIREIVLATNANKTLWNYRETGQFNPQISVQTLANAMDVGNPSNFERLILHFNSYPNFKQHVSVSVAMDSDIKKSILDEYQNYKSIICPHTATAFFARKNLPDAPWIIVSTAEAGKFRELVSEIILNSFPLSSQLSDFYSKPIISMPVSANLSDIQDKVCAYFKM